MPAQAIFLLIATAGLVSAAEESTLIRRQEGALAEALNKKDKALLSELTDPNLKIRWAMESAEQIVSTEMQLEEITSKTGPIQKRFQTIDLWIKQQGSWKLRQRHSSQIWLRLRPPSLR